MFKDFLIWSSGADREILAFCEEHVRTKYVGLGALIIIPAILAFVSMSYALSVIDIISGKPFFYIIGGMIWCFSVFFIDRYIVSTQLNGNGWKKTNIITFILRFVMALILGLSISHPLTLLFFDGNISEELHSELNNKKEIIQKKFMTVTKR